MSLQKISKIGDAAVNGALDLIKQIITERLDSVEELKESAKELAKVKLAQARQQLIVWAFEAGDPNLSIITNLKLII